MTAIAKNTICIWYDTEAEAAAGFCASVFPDNELFGSGRRLFEALPDPAPHFRIDRVIDTPAATHLRYVRA